MDPEGFQSLMYNHQYDFDETFSQELQALIEAPFHSPLDFQLPKDSQADGCGGRPRGGKKPLRAWQQQLGALEAQLAQKERDLRKAQEEGERLRQRIKVLEAVLPIREHLTRLLRQRPRTAEDQRMCVDYYPSHKTIEELRASSSSGGLSTSDSDASLPAQQQRSDADDPGPDGFLTRGARTLRQLVTNREEIVPLRLLPSTGAEPGPGSRAAAASTSQGHGPRHNHHVPFSCLLPDNHAPPHVIQRIVSFWDKWVREAGLALHAHDARPSDPSTILWMEELREQLAVTFTPARTDYPLLLTGLIGLNIKTGTRDEHVPESFWLPVAQGLKVTPDQVAATRAALELHRDRVDGLLQERRGLMGQLTARMAAGAAARPLLSANTFGLTALAAWDHILEEVTAQLYRNVVAEGQALEVTADFMGGSLFTLPQMIRASVLSYPYFPDGFAILNTIVATAACPTNG